MRAFLTRHSHGALIQASSTLALATQAFAAPRILGPLEYGRALVLVTGPFLIQAMLETVLLSLTIQSRRRAADGSLRLSTLWGDAAWLTLLGGVAWGVLGLSPGRDLPG